MEYQSTSTPDGLAPKQTIYSPQGTTTVPQGIKQDPIPLELCEICIHGVEVCYTPILPMNFFPKECIFCENFYHPAEITFFCSLQTCSRSRNYSFSYFSNLLSTSGLAKVNYNTYQIVILTLVPSKLALFVTGQICYEMVYVDTNVIWLKKF